MTYFGHCLNHKIFKFQDHTSHLQVISNYLINHLRQNVRVRLTRKCDGCNKNILKLLSENAGVDTIVADVNLNLGLRQAKKCGRVKLVNRILPLVDQKSLAVNKYKQTIKQ